MRGRIAPLILLAVPVLALAGRPSKRLSDHDRGELLYQRHCMQCHGATNAGNGPAAEHLVAVVPDLRGGMSQERREELVPVLLDGRGSMPSFQESFGRYDARRVLRYMAMLPPEVPPPEAADDTPPDDTPPDDPDTDAGDDDDEGDAAH